MPPSTEAAVRRRRRRRQLEAQLVGDYNLSPGEHGGSQYILSPGHESEEEEEEYDGEDTLMPLRRDEGKNFLAALKEEGDKMMMKVDNVQNKHDASETTTNTTATTLLGKKQKRMAVLNRKPSIEVDSSGTMVTNFNNIANKSRVMFPIFSKGQKTVHLVRHGQSTYNEAISGPGSWEEPKIFDARLTELGIEQAKKLGKFLSKLPKDAVWITSPLTRAMQTCVYGRESMYAFVEEQQQQQHLGKSSPDENAAPANNNNHNNNSNYNDSNRKSSLRRKAKKNETTTTDFKEVDNEAHFNNNNDSNTTTHKEWGRNVVIRPEITEKLSCSGDIGRPKGELISDMPLFEHSLSKLPDDTWWWETEEKRNDATEQIFNSNEPTRVFQRRVDKFRQWILSHPSNTFVVFGHSTFFKEMIGRSLKNCEVASLQL
jgi:broad specificity phosphatase PhoE